MTRSQKRVANIYNLAKKQYLRDHAEVSVTPTIQEFIRAYKYTNPDVNIFLSLLEEGDLLDTDDYRGNGLWYYDGKVLHKSTGQDSMNLPPQAYKMAHKYGVEYYHGLPGFILDFPKDLEVYVNGQPARNDGSGMSVDGEAGGDDVIKVGNSQVGYRIYTNVDYYKTTP